MEKVLIVDDEIKICAILEKFLSKKGYDTVTANSAEEGIEKLKTEKPNVILLDIRMAGLNGLQAISKIREIDEKVGIIMITAVMDEETALECIKAGASDYITKPMDFEYLEKTLLVMIAMMK